MNRKVSQLRLGKNSTQEQLAFAAAGQNKNSHKFLTGSDTISDGAFSGCDGRFCN